MKRLIAIFFFIITVSGTFAQDTSYLSLDNLIRKIESSFPEVLKYEQNIKAIENQAMAAKAWMAPSFSGGLSRIPYSLVGMNEMTPMNQAGIMLSFNQMIPNPKILKNKSEYIKSLTDIEKSNQEWTKNELCLLGKKYYYARYISDKKLFLVKENIQLLDLVISSSEKSYLYNQSQLTSIYKAKAKKEELKNMHLMIQSFAEESNYGMNTLLNRPINVLISVDTILYPKSNYITFDDSLVRSDIQAMQNSIASMILNKKYIQSLSKPDFGINVQHMLMFGMPNQFSIMGMVTIPMAPWSNRMYKSELKAMDYNISSMKFEIERMQLMAKQMANEKLMMYYYALKQWENYRKFIIPSFQKNLDINMLAFKQTTGSYFELLDAWEMLLMKQMEEWDMLFNVLKLQAEYEFQIEY